MGQRLSEALEDFAGGVITSLQPDELPPNASPYGRNSALTSIAGGKAVVQKRSGFRTVNASPITGSPKVFGQHLYRRRDATTGAISKYLLTISDNGRLDYVDTAGTVTSISTALDSTSPNPPDFATANNLAFFANGTDSQKVTIVASAPTMQVWGIVAPSAPSISAGAAGGMTGTYEVALSYYNSATGQESSRSPVSSVVLAAQKLNLTIPNATDPQVDYVRVHIRKTTLSAYLFRVASGTGYQTAGSGWVDNYGALTLDLSDNDLLALLVLSPDEDENDPPPTGIRFIEWHNTRMFASDGKFVYYSKVGLPESFDPEFFERVNQDDGQPITALHSAYGLLIVFKHGAMYTIDGDDPNTWVVRLVDPDIGCTSHRSVVTIEGITYWWSDRGPVAWDGQGAPRILGLELLQPTVSTDNLEVTQFENVVAAGDIIRQRVLFGVAEADETRNTLVLPYNYRLQRFDADGWDGMDPASLGVWEDSSSTPWVLFGGYAGQLFELWSATNDGVPSGTSSGTVVPGATSLSTLTDSGASFLNTGGKLIERKLTLVDSDGVVVGFRRITANTGTTLTLDSSITSLTSTATYSYYIGGPNFEWRTYWSSFGLPFHKKRFGFLHLLFKAASNITAYVDMAFDFDLSYGHTRNFLITPPSTAWDTTLVWTASAHSTGENLRKRFRIGRTGRVWRVAIRNFRPDQPLTILKIAADAEQMTTKS